MIAIVLVAYVANVIMGAPHEDKRKIITLAVWIILATITGYLIDRRHKKKNQKE